MFDIDESSIIDGSSLPQIRAATLAKLVERITHEKRINEAALQAFMLTYKYNSLTHHTSLAATTPSTAATRVVLCLRACGASADANVRSSLTPIWVRTIRQLTGEAAFGIGPATQVAHRSGTPLPERRLRTALFPAPPSLSPCDAALPGLCGTLDR